MHNWPWLDLHPNPKCRIPWNFSIFKKRIDTRNWKDPNSTFAILESCLLLLYCYSDHIWQIFDAFFKSQPTVKKPCHSEPHCLKISQNVTFFNFVIFKFFFVLLKVTCLVTLFVNWDFQCWVRLFLRFLNTVCLLTMPSYVESCLTEKKASNLKLIGYVVFFFHEPNHIVPKSWARANRKIL